MNEMTVAESTATGEGTWYLLTLRTPAKWKTSLAHLEKDFGKENVWFPLETSEKFIRGKKQVREAPLFSGYVFLRMNDFVKLSQHLKDDLSSEVKLVTLGGGVVSNEEMKASQNFANNLTPRTIAQDYHLGDRVRITSGAFANFEGIVLEAKDESCKIELSIFGRQLPVMVSLKELVKI